MSIPDPALIDQLYRDKVRAAEEMTEEERFLAGPRLFDYACRIARDAIRADHPDYDDEKVEAELRRRIEIGRQLEQRR